MKNIDSLLSDQLQNHLSKEEMNYLFTIFDRFNGLPTLGEIWHLMDETWISLNCNPHLHDERITLFYLHPVWLLNGIFTEQHKPSIKNRTVFTEWIAKQSPLRVADIGGGFGSLARMLGKALPNSQIEIIEPHPHPAGITLAQKTPNVRYAQNLTEQYDLMIATDVFEHVPTPLELAAKTATHLQANGSYLMANNFSPCTLCHLPQLFHFRYAWDQCMQALGLQPQEFIGYGRAYQRIGSSDLTAAYRIEKCALSWRPWLDRLPAMKTWIGSKLIYLICR